MMPPLIDAKGLRMSYGSIEVLKDVNISVSKGEALAIIGPNGAGKTTLFKVLTGEVFATAGAIRYDNKDITREPAYVRSRGGFGRTFQVARVFPEMSVLENAVIAVEARLAQGPTTSKNWLSLNPTVAVLDKAQRILASLGMSEAADVAAKLLSHGDKKRLDLALALSQDPSVLMLDEPTAGMSPPERHQTVKLLTALRRERGLTLLLTEHDMDVVFGLADAILVLNYGEVIAYGSPESVRANPAVRAVYLGEEA